MTFLADRDGPFDVWVTQPGSGEFSNLSTDRFKVLYIGDLRIFGFADDDSHVRVHVPVPGSPPGEGSVLAPAIGGNPRPFLAASASEVDWTADGMRAAAEADARRGWRRRFPVPKPRGRTTLE